MLSVVKLLDMVGKQLIDSQTIEVCNPLWLLPTITIAYIYLGIIAFLLLSCSLQSLLQLSFLLKEPFTY